MTTLEDMLAQLQAQQQQSGPPATAFPSPDPTALPLPPAPPPYQPPAVPDFASMAAAVQQRGQDMELAARGRVEATPEVLAKLHKEGRISFSEYMNGSTPLWTEPRMQGFRMP